MLEHYNVSKMTKGIDLERSTLRDWVKKPISHLGGLEVENLAVRKREGVSRRRNTLRRMPHLPFSTLVTGEEDWEEEAPVMVEKERD
jgi:hypothetical protein